MPERMIVSAAPHVRSSQTTTTIMRDVLIALTPASLAGVWLFGLNAAFVIIMGVTSAVLTEFITLKIMKRPIVIKDLSAAVTGLLLALNLPPDAPLWLPVVGSAVAIVLVKQIFGGVGNNFLNPALAARAILQISWPVHMTTWRIPGQAVDALTMATPLGEGAAKASYIDLFMGNVGGTIGEVCKLALLLGAAYLLIRGIISWRIPFAYLASVAVMSLIFGQNGEVTGDMLYQLLSGGLILGAFFMATDYSSSPTTPIGQLIMGAGCGIVTFVIRAYGGYPEGVSYSILIMNLFTPLIERYTRPRVFGEVKRSA